MTKKNETKKQTKYDYKKTLIKVGKNVAYVFLAGLAAMYSDNPVFLAIAPALTALENYMKHK